MSNFRSSRRGSQTCKTNKSPTSNWLRPPSPKRNRSANLSGGQQQRFAVTRPPTLRPTIILAEESTRYLDTKPAEGVFALISKVNRANTTTILLFTHNMDLASRCRRIIEIVDGRTKSDGPGSHAKTETTTNATGENLR